MTGSQHPFLRKFLLRLMPRRADILGREQGQALVRVVLSSAVVAYLVFHHHPMDWFGEFPPWLTFSLTFILLALVIAVMALRASRTSLPRRVISNIADITAITYLILNTGEAGAPLFVLYLWVTLGNGFRFGLRAMVFSAVLSFTGFSFVLLVSDTWGGHKMFGIGVMVALVVLPGYAAHLIRQLHLARERAEEASAAKSRFLARMSHELRTPLNGILGTTDLLRNNRRLTNEDRDLLGVIQDSVAVSLRQIDSVLDYAKLEAGKLVIDSADFDLHELINASVRMVRPSVRDKNLYLLMKISPDVPYRLVGDPHHLREIILNLLSNAVKFTESGYVLIEINRTSAHDQMVTLRFEIRDTGIGISPEALERVWESFSQEETGTTRRFGGTGLGTTIAKQLVELMGGRIDVASLKGRGTVFWFEVPFQLQTAAVDVRDGVAGTRVLLVSNNITSINHMGKCIDNIGGNLVIASSLQEAVSSLGRGIRLNNPWHLIFVDDRLAVTSDNFHLAGELTKKAGVMHAPVYLLSDIQRNPDQIYSWGYSSVYRTLVPQDTLRYAAHASPHFDDELPASERVVNVEPWAWNSAPRVARRILIADDNKTNRLILQQILESAGYQVEAVDNGDDALVCLSSGTFKAAVLDMHMPGIDGVQLLRQYKRMAGGRTIPLIMLTADVTFDAKRDCAEAGADAFLTKPARSDALLSMLEGLIHDSEVHVLPTSITAQRHDREEAVTDEQAVLDLSVLGELDRVCRDPVRLSEVVETFASEGVVLLERIRAAAGGRNHSGYAEWVHALKGNAANVGAVRLAEACRRAGAVDLIGFHREGIGTSDELGASFDEALHALRDLIPPVTSPGRSGPV